VLVGIGAVSATLALAGWTLASPTPYPIVANALDLQPLRQVSANDAAVAVVVHTDPRTLVRLAHVLERRGISATFAVDAKPSRRALAAVRAAGDEVLPACASAGPTALLRRERQLRHLASSLGSRGRYYYLAPGSGFSFAEYLAIRSTGGVPVAGSVTLDGHEAAARARVRAGSIIVVGLGPRKPERMLRQLTTLTRERGLEPVSLSTLLASDRSA
jgi:hypothetical protein